MDNCTDTPEAFNELLAGELAVFLEDLKTPEKFFQPA